MRIDVHVHTFPDMLAQRALKKLTEKAHAAIQPVADGTLTALLNGLRRDQMDYAVVCPIATRPEHFDPLLQEALAIRSGERGEVAARHLIPLASVHPDDEACFEHLTQVAETGLCGVKLHPYYQKCVLDDPHMLEYFRCCRDLGLVVQCHCGFDIGFPRDPICGPERVARVMREVPGLRLIAAHLGGCLQWDGVVEHLLGREVYLDTAILTLNQRDPLLHTILREHPAERLLFATDWPWLDFADGMTFVRTAGLSPTRVARMLGDNAARLFGVSAAIPAW